MARTVCFLMLTLILTIAVSAPLAAAHTKEELAAGAQLVADKVPCALLTDEQLRSLGEYYMERMHPEETHELMDRMMGLEDSAEADKQFHISLARTLYCGTNDGIAGMMYSGGMMNMMARSQSRFPYSMMNSWQYSSSGTSFVESLWVLFLLLLIVALVIWIVKLLKKPSRGKATSQKYNKSGAQLDVPFVRRHVLL